MPFIISDMPFSDATLQEEIDRRRAERMAKCRKTSRAKSSKKYQVEDQEKLMFPNLTGEFDEESPYAKHFPKKREFASDVPP